MVMDDLPSRDALIHRIADLEDQLVAYRDNQDDACASKDFGLTDFEHAADGICVCHAIAEFPFVRFIFWNRRMVDLTGYTREVINRKGWHQSVYPDPDLQAKAIARMAAMREGVNLEAETWEITRADGNKRNVRISTSVIDDGDGTPRVMAIMHDVTEQQHAEEELKSELAVASQALALSNAKFHNLFENAGDAIFVHDLEGSVIDANQKALALFGYSKPELLSFKIPMLHPTEALEQSKRAFEAILRDGHVRFEIDFINKHGEVIPAEVTSSLFIINGKEVIQGIVRDIRDRRAAEQSRRETLDIIEKSPVAAFLWRNEKDWPVEFVTRNVDRIFGYSDVDFFSGRVLYSKVVHPEDLQRVAHEVATYSQEPGRTAFVHEPYRIVALDGTVHWVNDQTFIRRDHTGSITHFQGIVEDISDKRLAAEQLAAEKERLAVTVRSIGDAVITTDREGRIALMNPIAEHLTGWKEADAIGRRLMNVFRIVDERTGEPCFNPVDKVLSSGKIVDLASHTMLVNRDGKNFIIADSGAPILDLQGEIIGVVLVFRDITSQQRIEKELLKMEKMKSLGVLAGGIAHDFNNFLTGIIGNLSLAKLDVQSGDSVSRALDEMEKAAVRAKNLTQQLLTFSKGGEPVRHTTNIGDLVRESAQFALRGSNVRSRFNIDEGLLLANVDNGQIAQVVHNLVINADQAMPNGGSLSIQVINVTLPPNNPYALEPGNYIQLSIHDEGIGIHPKHLKKIFDPYFSTKQKGSGLGLAVAYSIIAKHDGQLTVDSKLGRGATFTILLPASEDTHVDDSTETRGLVAGHGRILVMDDEDFIRELASVMLDKMGYAVATAPDGQAAVNSYKEALAAGHPFDVVILDLTVPGGMGGKETMRRLLRLDPNVRAIVSSGYSNDPVMANHARYGFCGAVKKPYLVQEMSQVLDAVIKG